MTVEKEKSTHTHKEEWLSTDVLVAFIDGWKRQTSKTALTFSAVLGPLFLLPLGRPLGRFGVGGPTGSCRVNIMYEKPTRGTARTPSAKTPEHHLLLLPRPTSAPALRLRSRLGGARLRRRLFGPTVTHAWVCPPASGSWASNPRRSCLESLEDREPECQRRRRQRRRKGV